MNIKLLTLSILLTSFGLNAQNDTIVIVERGENTILQAVVNLESSKTLYKGHSYFLNIVASSNDDIRINAKNVKIHFEAKGSQSTGGMRCVFTPIDTGYCSVTVGLIRDMNTQFSLLNQNYKVVEYPMPTVYLNNVPSGSIISSTNDILNLRCKYDPSSGVFDNFEILSWKAKLNGEVYEGTGNVLSELLTNDIQSSEFDSVLQLEVTLKENITGFLTAKSIYIINLN